MPGRPIDAETMTLADYLEARADAHIHEVVRRVLTKVVRTMLLCTVLTALVLVAAEVVTLQRVQSNTTWLADLEALTDSNRRWVAALKADQDEQARRYEHIAGQLAQIRGLMQARKAIATRRMR